MRSSIIDNYNRILLAFPRAIALDFLDTNTGANISFIYRLKKCHFLCKNLLTLHTQHLLKSPIYSVYVHVVTYTKKYSTFIHTYSAHWMEQDTVIIAQNYVNPCENVSWKLNDNFAKSTSLTNKYKSC